MVKKLRVTGLMQPQAEVIAEETGKLGLAIADQIMDEIDQRGFAKKSDLDAVHFELKTDVAELKHEIVLLRTELTSKIDSQNDSLTIENGFTQ